MKYRKEISHGKHHQTRLREQFASLKHPHRRSCWYWLAVAFASIHCDTHWYQSARAIPE